jgi:hypothetical protein
MPERIAPRKTKLGTLDLTASTLFINNIAMHARVGQCARAINRIFPFRHGRINMGAAVEFLFRTMHSIYKFWRQLTPFTPEDIEKYRALTFNLGDMWRTLGWRVSTWVHWTVRHSAALADLHHNFYLFSSIPTERRNVEFKMDVSHCFKGWKLSKPAASMFGFGHVLSLAALDCGLALYAARHRGKKRFSEFSEDNEEE